jgi:hypothetical protein
LVIGIVVPRENICCVDAYLPDSDRLRDMNIGHDFVPCPRTSKCEANTEMDATCSVLATPNSVLVTRAF